jgi:hypothetical protein
VLHIADGRLSQASSMNGHFGPQQGRAGERGTHAHTVA